MAAIDSLKSVVWKVYFYVQYTNIYRNIPLMIETSLIILVFSKAKDFRGIFVEIIHIEYVFTILLP